MLAVALVFLGQNFLEPMSLASRGLLVGQAGIMENRKFLPTPVTSESSHLPHVGRPFSRLSPLDRY